LIFVEGKRPGQITTPRREILATNEIGPHRVTFGSQTIEHSPEINEQIETGFVAEGRLLLAERAKPAQEMRVAAQLGEAEELGESRAEVGKESAYSRSILVHRAESQGEGQRLELSFEDLLEAGLSVHEI
jgi:hypothetical protein